MGLFVCYIIFSQLPDNEVSNLKSLFYGSRNVLFTKAQCFSPVPLINSDGSTVMDWLSDNGWGLGCLDWGMTF